MTSIAASATLRLPPMELRVTPPAQPTPSTTSASRASSAVRARSAAARASAPPAAVTAWVDTASGCQHPWPALACPLCGPAGGKATEHASAHAVGQACAAAIGAGATTLVLRGGEVLARPEALDLVAAARKGGAQAVTVWTSGTLLARPRVAAALRHAGVTQVVVPLWGDTAAGHDHVAALDGHFQRVVSGLQACRAARLPTAVVAPLLRPGFRNLPALIQKALPAGVSAVHLWAPDGPDRDAHPLLAPLQLMAPYIQAAAKLLATAQRTCVIEGVPPCLLGEYAPLRFQRNLVVDARSPQTLVPEAAASRERVYGPPCETCSWRAACRGLDSFRASAHGWAGIAARTDAVAAALA